MLSFSCSSSLETQVAYCSAIFALKECLYNFFVVPFNKKEMLKCWSQFEGKGGFWISTHTKVSMFHQKYKKVR